MTATVHAVSEAGLVAASAKEASTGALRSLQRRGTVSSVAEISRQMNQSSVIANNAKAKARNRCDHRRAGGASHKIGEIVTLISTIANQVTCWPEYTIMRRARARPARASPCASEVKIWPR